MQDSAQITKVQFTHNAGALTYKISGDDLSLTVSAKNDNQEKWITTFTKPGQHKILEPENLIDIFSGYIQKSNLQYYDIQFPAEGISEIPVIIKIVSKSPYKNLVTDYSVTLEYKAYDELALVKKQCKYLARRVKELDQSKQIVQLQNKIAILEEKWEITATALLAEQAAVLELKSRFNHS